MADVAAYFDERAEGWLEMEDSTRSPLQPAVAALAGVAPGSSVLDLGCGLGVMVPTYLELGAARVMGVDISEQMVRLASQRWQDEERVEFVAGDAACLSFAGAFDSVVIYNAYPHFMDRPALVEMCWRALAPGGRFVVAHSVGRERINAHHDAVAAGVSVGLQAADAEKTPWEERFAIDALIDTPRFYAFAGERIS